MKDTFKKIIAQLKTEDVGEYNTLLRKSYFILWVIGALLLIAFIWASFAKVDEVTRGIGKVIPSAQIQNVQNLEGGIIKEIKVKEGDLVQPGQVLMIIDDTRFSSQSREAELKIASLELKIIRLNAEINESALDIPAQFTQKYPDLAKYEKQLYDARMNEFKTKLTSLNAQITQKKQELIATQSKKKHLEDNDVLVQKELKMTEPLVKEGVVSEVELLRLQQQANSLKSEISNLEITIPKINSEIAEAENKVEESKTAFKTDLLKQITDAKAELNGLQENFVAIKDRVERTLVRSPLKGIVNLIKINTIGGVVQPGMDLVEIVPIEDTLVIEAKIRPADVAFLHPGQKAVVRFTAYDFAVYGGLTGKLEHISADTIEDKNDETFYLIRVRTDKPYLGSAEHPLTIIPGMTAEVDIITGKKSILSYLLKPLLRAQQRALRER